MAGAAKRRANYRQHEANAALTPHTPAQQSPLPTTQPPPGVLKQTHSHRPSPAEAQDSESCSITRASRLALIDLPNELKLSILSPLLRPADNISYSEHCLLYGPQKCELFDDDWDDACSYQLALRCKDCGINTIRICPTVPRTDNCCHSLHKASYRAWQKINARSFGKHNPTQEEVVSEIRKHMPHLGPSPVPAILSVSKDFDHLLRKAYWETYRVSFTLGHYSIEQPLHWIRIVMGTLNYHTNGIAWSGDLTESAILGYFHAFDQRLQLAQRLHMQIKTTFGFRFLTRKPPPRPWSEGDCEPRQAPDEAQIAACTIQRLVLHAERAASKTDMAKQAGAELVHHLIFTSNSKLNRSSCSCRFCEWDHFLKGVPAIDQDSFPALIPGFRDTYEE